ncbi:MAG: hypothetical protein GX095_05755 [Clostridiales bacterium]|jgi:hypothetical protein|nr:hypothetical protein [Clostridiales bacterium]HOB64062.1 carbohydrate-binding family 9-like protein [Clostridia bacterium]HOK82493.1 carbohydrate-binding family 9-like protein [Clostridia bacterium]HOL61622.1 carbohydrate-binding family 9-like protein [Clostridia bacterium]HPO54262.1 carbohydrate-binding family 9-like protein [Clostridia bacterium]
MPLRIRIAGYTKTKDLFENVAGGDCEQHTAVSYYHDGENLVFVFDCVEASPVVFGDKDNDKLYKGDVVEVMITLGRPERYLEVSVNPARLKYAAIVDNPDRDGSGITVTPIEENPVETEVLPTEAGYAARITIPIAWLKEIGWSADCSLINFYRQDFNDAGDLRLYALSPTRSASFHKPDAFVPMEILM